MPKPYEELVEIAEDVVGQIICLEVENNLLKEDLERKQKEVRQLDELLKDQLAINAALHRIANEKAS